MLPAGSRRSCLAAMKLKVLWHRTTTCFSLSLSLFSHLSPSRTHVHAHGRTTHAHTHARSMKYLNCCCRESSRATRRFSRTEYLSCSWCRLFWYRPFSFSLFQRIFHCPRAHFLLNFILRVQRGFQLLIPPVGVDAT